jgi:hypothetical protein
MIAKQRVSFCGIALTFGILTQCAAAEPAGVLHPFRLGPHTFGENKLAFVMSDQHNNTSYNSDFFIISPAHATSQPLPPNLDLDARGWHAAPGQRQALVVRTYDVGKNEIDIGYSKCSDTNGGDLGLTVFAHEWEPTRAREAWFSFEQYDCSDSALVLERGEGREDPQMLARLVKSPDLRAREIAGQILRNLGKRAAPARDQLAAHLAADGASVDFSVLFVLAKLKDKRAIPYLVNYLDDKSSLSSTLQALREFGPEASAALPKLRELQKGLDRKARDPDLSILSLDLDRTIFAIDLAARESDEQCRSFKKQIAALQWEVKSLQTNCNAAVTPETAGTEGAFPVECLFMNDEIRDLRAKTKVARDECQRK